MGKLHSEVRALRRFGRVWRSTFFDAFFLSTADGRKDWQEVGRHGMFRVFRVVLLVASHQYAFGLSLGGWRIIREALLRHLRI